MASEWSGERLREVRLKAGETQASLGVILSVTSRAISRWERGVRSPRGRNRRAVDAWMRSAGRRGEALRGGGSDDQVALFDSISVNLRDATNMIEADGHRLSGAMIEDIRAAANGVIAALEGVTSPSDT